MKQSIGILEIEGFLAVTASIDAMVKHAYVELLKVEKTGSGWMTIIVQGDLASVQAAIEFGLETAQKLGNVISVKTIPRPDDTLYSKLLSTPNRTGEQ